MNILKALFLTVLLLTIDSIVTFGIYILIEDYIPPDYLLHYFGLTLIIPRLIAYLIIFITFKINFKSNNGHDRIRMIKLNTIFYILILTIGLELFDRPFFDFRKIVDFLQNNVAEPYQQLEFSNISIIYKGISAVILAPIFEELLFRKYMFTELLKKYSTSISIVISSVFFSLIHLPSYRNLLPTFIFGVISCLIYRKTKNIYYTIILHFLANLSWLTLGIYGEQYYKWIYELEFNMIYWILFGLGIILIMFGLKKITTANKRYNSLL